MKNQKSILFIEDNADDVELTKMAFHEAKIANPLMVVRDGVEALDYLFGRGAFAARDTADLPVVVLLDLNLPRLSGLDVLREIRRDPRTRHLPTVILTSSTEEEDRLGSYDLGANSYVRKPVDYDELVRAARQLGLYWTVLDEPPPRGGT